FPGPVQSRGIIKDRQRALVPRRHLPGGFENLVAQPAGGESLVIADLRPAEVAGDPPAREIQADRDLGVPLVDTVADAEPAAELAPVVEAVDVHALVEVHHRLDGVGVLVFGRKTEVRHGTPSAAALPRSMSPAGRTSGS